MDLKIRPCRIGSSINVRREKHGDNNITALDIPIREFMLTADELNSLTDEPHAHQVLFNHAKGGLIEPVFRKFKPIRLVGKLEEVGASIKFNDEAMLCHVCTVSKLSIEPRIGGLSAFAFTIQCTPKLDGVASRMLEKLDAEVMVEIVGIGEQANLDFADDSEEEADEELEEA